MSETSTARPSEEDGELKRVMGPGLLLLFIVGDILGTGIYALTGTVAKEVGGAVWLPFLLAFAVALMTAFAYLELVTKYPEAGGAAVYTHRAYGVGFLTFMVAFTVMCSGITSASTASRAFAENFLKGFHMASDPTVITVVALCFMALVMGINLYGVGESVKLNVVLTLIELSGLLIVIFVGFMAVAGGRADFSRTMIFESPSDKSWFLAVSAATSVAFFAMVGFEDSVNMAEETKDPSRIFPKIMLTGLTITGIIYVLVSLTAVAIVPIGQLTQTGATPLLTVVQMGAPGLPFAAIFPFISMFAVANTALINMMMASRLLYGMAKQQVLPPWFGWVLKGRRTPWFSIVFTTALAAALITFVGQVSELGGTTALLLLAVFTLTNIAVLVLRKDKVDHDHFRAPTWVPIAAALCTFYLVGPWTGRPLVQFWIALVLIAIGAVLGVITWAVNKRVYHRDTQFSDITMVDDGTGTFN
ncbi:APC family permease [Nigerium massiliense]|uniref:APC family permease n=1 Tax=Nigerium massiliense TaxID=1522317 RepID=UPI00058DDD56|nr:APC family permease [Nigerium massiliense]